MDKLEVPKRNVSLPEVFITAVVMVVVGWAWNRIADSNDIRIEEGQAARNRELDKIEFRLNHLEQTDIEILKMLNEHRGAQ